MTKGCRRHDLSYWFLKREGFGVENLWGFVMRFGDLECEVLKTWI